MIKFIKILEDKTALFRRVIKDKFEGKLHLNSREKTRRVKQTSKMILKKENGLIA